MNTILTERPKNMDYKKFHTIRKQQKRDIRRYLRSGTPIKIWNERNKKLV